MVDNNKSMRSRITLLATCILLVGCSCKEKRKPKDPFYAFKGGGEMNIPLVKPFHLFSFGKGWSLSEDEYAGYEQGGCSILCVQRFQGSDSLFLFRSYGGWGILIRSKSEPEGWFIMDVANKTINGYTDYKVFRDTLFSQYQITVDTLSWRTPKSFYKEFKRKGTLPWFP